VPRQAERGISAPPEVVFNTAIDPDRRNAWLPGGVRVEAGEVGEETFEARLSADGDGPSGRLRVEAGASGGSSVSLQVEGGSATPDEILTNLAREVTDNFNSG